MILTVEGNIIDLLMFLAPGLVVVGIFRSLTAYPPPRVSDQIAQALVYTIFVQVICWGIVDKFETDVEESGAVWIKPYPPYITFPLAVLVAIFLVATYGKNTFHKLLRRLGTTRETSFPPEWYSVFRQHRDCYVILHLAGERRIYGRPKEWPSKLDKGHFRLSEYSWLTKDEVDETNTLEYPSQDQLVLSYSRASILIPASDVGMVEFIGILPEDENERE